MREASGKSLGQTSSSSEESGSSSPRAGTSWLDVAWLMLSDIVGTSVLTFAGIAQQLGWLPTVLFIAGLFPVSLFVSICMAESRTYVVKTAALLGQPPPRMDTMGEMALATIRSPRAGSIVYFIVYGTTLLGQASYLLVLGTSLQDVFLYHDICVYTAVLISCVFVAIVVTRLRRLSESVLLCCINSLLIVAVVVVALSSIVARGPEPCTTSPAVNPKLTFMAALGAATNLVYSFAGQWMYFELMETMEEPRHFPRAFAVVGPVMVITYLTVALVGYFFGVKAGNIVDGMEEGTTMRVVSAMLFVHVVIVYVIKSVVLQRYFHRRLSPKDVDSRSLAGYCKHGGVGVAMLAFGFVVANAVPFFSQLLGLIGGFFAGPINFIFPIYIYLSARGRYWRAYEERRGAEPGEALSDDSSSEDEVDSNDGVVHRLRGTTWKESSRRAAARAARSLPPAKLLFILAILVLIVLTMVLGVTDVIQQIIELNGEFGTPFSCHARRHRVIAAANTTCTPEL